MNFSSITLIDYGVGNLASFVNMLNFIGVEVIQASKASQIRDAQKLLLPGVGAFDRAMAGLNSSGLREPLDEAVCERKVPILGVCLGMQLMGESSEEGQMAGLGWLRARSIRLTPDLRSKLKVPNNGWQDVYVKKPTTLIPDHEGVQRFYFNHSYHMVCENPDDVSGLTEFDGAKVCIVTRGNIAGVQFHPEKSHRYGMSLLSAFARL